LAEKRGWVIGLISLVATSGAFKYDFVPPDGVAQRLFLAIAPPKTGIPKKQFFPDRGRLFF